MKRLLFFTPLLLLANSITDIKFEGLKHISKISANEISLLHKGDEFNLEKVDLSIKKFYKYGYFKKIEADFQNGVLTYKFIEKPIILKINYKDVSETLKKLLKDKIKKGMIFSEEKLKEIREFITSYYDGQGEFNSIVIFDKEFKNNGVILTINLQKGEHITISDLKFYGVTKENIEDLKEEMINKNRDIFGFLPFRNSGEFKFQGLLMDSRKLKDYYLSKGYLDVKVSNPLFVVNFDNNKAILEYKIYEGKRYKTGKIDINLPKPVFEIDKMKQKLHLLSGYYFNVKKLRKDLEMIRREVADKGYAYAKVYPKITKNGEIADVTYNVILGKKVYISDVEIEGNTKTLDRVIRRDIYLIPNYLYSLTDEEDTISALKRSGYFDKVELKKIKVDDTHMKILIKVKEGLTGSLRAGISYNSYSKFGFNINLAERNIFGSGQTLGIDFEKSIKTERYSLNLKNPRVFDSKYFLSTSLYNKNYTGYSYSSKRKGVSFTTGRKITRHTNFSVTYGYEVLNLNDETTEDENRRSIKNYLMPTLSFNNTDDYFFPQHGIISNLNLEYAGFGGDQKFIKTKELFKIFYSLEDRFDITTILKYKFKAGQLSNNGYLPLSEKFYLGGLGTIRGYDYGSISPKDEEGNSVGGNLMMINSVEVSIPISFKRKIWLSAFVDNGAIGENNMNITRSSYGISLDWITPIGPLDFTWAWAINPRKNDKLRKFEFSIGSNF